MVVSLLISAMDVTIALLLASTDPAFRAPVTSNAPVTAKLAVILESTLVSNAALLAASRSPRLMPQRATNIK